MPKVQPEKGLPLVVRAPRWVRDGVALEATTVVVASLTVDPLRSNEKSARVSVVPEADNTINPVFVPANGLIVVAPPGPARIMILDVHEHLSGCRSRSSPLTKGVRTKGVRAL